MEGINSRMDGIQAAILNVKLPHLPGWTTARRRVAARYNDLLWHLDNLSTPKEAEDRSHVYHLYVVTTDTRDLLKKALADGGITTSLNYPKALPFYPAYAYLEHKPADFPAAYHTTPAARCQSPAHPPPRPAGGPRAGRSRAAIGLPNLTRSLLGG